MANYSKKKRFNEGPTDSQGLVPGSDKNDNADKDTESK